MLAHDPAYNEVFAYWGNVTLSSNLIGGSSAQYDIGGNVMSKSLNGLTNHGYDEFRAEE